LGDTIRKGIEGLGMKLWLLRNLDRRGYDIALDMLIAATDEDTARNMAAEQSGDEGQDTWRNRQHSTCIELIPENIEREYVVVRSFRAG
jgi:hypothetical protein